MVPPATNFAGTRVCLTYPGVGGSLLDELCAWEIRWFFMSRLLGLPQE